MEHLDSYSLAWIGILSLFLMLSAEPATAQMQVGQARLAQPIGDSTAVWSSPTRSSNVLSWIDAEVILRSVGMEFAEDGDAFYRVIPTEGANFSWDTGYIHESELEVGIDLPWQVHGGIYGALATTTSQEYVLPLGNGTGLQNPFGAPGTSRSIGLGVIVSGGYFIPTGAAGLRPKLELGLAFLGSREDPENEISSTFNMYRGGLGADLVYRMTPRLDISAGTLVGGGLVSNTYTFANDQTLSVNATFGTVDLLAGVGFGRNYTPQGGIFKGVRVRLEGGYRFGFRLGDWSYTVQDEESDESASTDILLEDGDESLSLSGPLLRVVVGL